MPDRRSVFTWKTARGWIDDEEDDMKVMITDDSDRWLEQSNEDFPRIAVSFYPYSEPPLILHSLLVRTSVPEVSIVPYLPSTPILMRPDPRRSSPSPPYVSRLLPTSSLGLFLKNLRQDPESLPVPMSHQDSLLVTPYCLCQDLSHEFTGLLRYPVTSPLFHLF